jgi:hypothetical protein
VATLLLSACAYIAERTQSAKENVVEGMGETGGQRLADAMIKADSTTTFSNQNNEERPSLKILEHDRVRPQNLVY